MFAAANTPTRPSRRRSARCRASLTSSSTWASSDLGQHPLILALERVIRSFIDNDGESACIEARDFRQLDNASFTLDARFAIP